MYFCVHSMTKFLLFIVFWSAMSEEAPAPPVVPPKPSKTEITFELAGLSGDDLLRQLCYRLDSHWFENVLLEKQASEKIAAQVTALRSAADKLRSDGFSELAAQLDVLIAELEVSL